MRCGFIARIAAVVSTALAVIGPSASARAEDFDRPPINYASTRPDNAITRLQAKIDSGKTTLRFTDEHGYLEAVLKELDIPKSSQVLVFSKTSLQRDRISPRTPRALYFNDEVSIGFVRLGEVLEVTSSDPKLGTVFHTLNQEPVSKPRFNRHGDNCLTCHLSRFAGVPAWMVRSVYPDREGHPILTGGSHRIDHTSPIKNRWGGWYVTGTHGEQTHLGNLTLKTRQVPETLDNKQGQNVTSLKDRIDTGMYLTPHSDLIALMVLEHQAEMHNALTGANYQTRMAQRDADVLNQMDGKPKGGLTEGTARRIDSAAENVVKLLLFHEEAELTDPMAGTSKFAEEFAARGPKDAKGRSLRDFDLKKRIFKYPCSYLVYSSAFDGLPEVLQIRIYRRLYDVLTAENPGPDFEHLSAADRTAIREILVATKKGLPKFFK